MIANRERGYLIVQETEYRIVAVAPVKPPPVNKPNAASVMDGELVAGLVFIAICTFLVTCVVIEVIDGVGWIFQKLMAL